MQNRTSVVSLAIGLAILYSVATEGATFNIPNGDVGAFKYAIQSANFFSGPDTIVLADNGDYSFTAYHATSNPLNRTALPIITSEITIEGNGSVIRRADSIAMP